MPDPGSGSRRGVLGSLLALIGAGAIALAALVWFGFVDVSASGKEPAALTWFLHESREHAVERAVDKGALALPADFTDPARRDRGFVHYQAMCVTCHGAPGIEPSEIGRGLNPPAPDLAEKRDEPEAVFWIVQHGIRMTGMPAFGTTHDAAALWDIAAFVGELPDSTPEAYAARLAAAGLALGSVEHSHPEAATSPESVPHEHAPGEHHPPEPPGGGEPR